MTAGVDLRPEAPIESVNVCAFRVPTEEPESDGTLRWSATTLVYVEIRAAGKTGIGYTYASAAAAIVIRDILQDRLRDRDALHPAARYEDLCRAVRNEGRAGIAAMAISACDIALWDVKAKVLEVPACVLLGMQRDGVPVYGSGGFTSYPHKRLCEQMSAFVCEQGIPRVKMKVGRDPQRDPARVAAVRDAIGPAPSLFVDANGAYSVEQALEFSREFAAEGVSWFEEPVDHDDLEGNANLRALVPTGMEIANGEYCYSSHDFLRLVRSQAADVVQADVTRCGGFSGFIAADAICRAGAKPLSSHCAPYATLHAAAAAKALRHAEYFYDHVRIERMLFDGPSAPIGGRLVPDLQRPGIGLEIKRSDAERFAL